MRGRSTTLDNLSPVRSPFAVAAALLFRHAIPVLVISFSIGVASVLWYVSRFQSNLIETMALDNAALSTRALAEFRTLYTREVVERVRPQGVEITHDYDTKEGAIPLPATLTIELGASIGENGSGVGAQLYSPYPFPWRRETGGLRDDFKRDAWSALSQNPTKPFYRFEQVQGRPSLRYATADLMRPSCVSCHNNRPDTPKNDWQVGDVRGVLEITYPMESILAQTSAGLRGTLLLVGMLSSVGLSMIALVIRKHRRDAAELEASEEKYRTVFQQCEDAIFLSSTDGEIVDANESMLALFGYSRAEMRKLRAHELYVDPEERDRIREEIGEHGSVREYPAAFSKKDGAEIKCLVTASLRRSPDGEIIGYQGIIRDITEFTQLEEQLRQSQKMEAVGQLAGGVAHDFNNVLTGITGYTQLALGQLPGEGSVADDLGKVLDAAHRAAGVTHQLLAFSRRQPLNPQVLNLNALVKGASEMLEPLIGEDIETRFVVAAELGNVRADRGHLEQVLVNLVINARDAMPDGGQLTIETTNVTLDEEYSDKYLDVTPGRYVVLAVTDTGIGMDNETRRQIFEPFFTTKKVGKGTGLGLATVYGIVKQHEGDIHVYSEQGKGTTFRVYLPLVEERPESVEERIEAPPARGSETILIVEDDEYVRVVSQRGLETYGYRVLVAASPSEAEELFSEHAEEIELLLTDVVMPEMDGTALHRQLSRKAPSLKVLYMSGYASRAVRRKVLAPGRSFLSKPFTPEQLAQNVRRVLDN